MSRSYRKPYSAITGVRSAAADKQFAAQGVRRKQNQYLRNAVVFDMDWDEFLIPHRYECNHNDVWGWGRDGNQRLCSPPKFEDHLHWFHCHYWTDEQAMEHALESLVRAEKWFEYLKRK